MTFNDSSRYNRDRQSVTRRILGYMLPYKWRIALSMLASLGVSGTDIAIAKLVQPFVDKLVVAGDMNTAKIVPIVIISLAAVKGFSRYFQEYFIRTGGQLVVQNIRDELFHHSVILSIGFFSKTSSGTLMSRILNDVAVLQNALAVILVGGLRESLTLVGLTAVAFYADWKMALMAFVVLPLAGGPAIWIGNKIKQYSRRGQHAMGILTTILEQTFSGIKVIKAFGGEHRESEKFRQENLSYYRFFRKMVKYDSITSPFIEIISSFGVAGIVFYGMHRVISGQMTQGELFSIMTAIFLMYTPVKRMTRVNNVLQQAIGAAERIFEILDERPEITDVPGATVLERVRGEVSFEHVDFAYQDELVLKDFHITAMPGEVIALVGPSGAGKSTAASLLARFYDPSAGRILFDGHDIKYATLDSVRANIALVDQETFLFNDTIENNIRYGRPDASEKDVLRAAELAFSHEFINDLPEGYQTKIGDRGLRLSGGQRQRICIARAILQDAPILILDEATSALDTKSEAMVQKALGNLMQNRTTFVVAHRLSTIMHADKIVVLEAGHIREIGTHQELIDKGGIYCRLYEMQ
ncbi:MAG TPA: ATP-binding cassette domain-containing protein [Thermodesulfobacteriaceae bacterium]|nr:ATP-binding cassette domain-containing protein [Thermodesulfobacteriaceae bacterium]